MNLNRSIAKRTRAAFTLMEVMFATMAFSIIILVIKSTFYGALNLQEKASTRLNEFAPRERALELIKRDLRNLVFTGGAMATNFVGEALGSVEYPNDRIEFCSSTGIVSDHLPWSDLQIIEYFLTEPLVATNGTPQGLDLVRSVRRNLTAAVEEVPEYQRIASGLRSLDFAYYDGLSWQDTWDAETQESPLPLAIRAIVEFDTRDADGESAQRFRNEVRRPIEVVVPILVQPIENEEEAEETEEEETEGDDPPSNPGGNNGGGGDNAGGRGNG